MPSNPFLSKCGYFVAILAGTDIATPTCLQLFQQKIMSLDLPLPLADFSGLRA